MMRSKKGMSTRTLAMVLILVFAVLILWFFSGFIIKFTTVAAEAATAMVKNLINFFISLVGGGLIPPI